VVAVAVSWAHVRSLGICMAVSLSREIAIVVDADKRQRFMLSTTTPYVLGEK
jgi:hypothetical protein